VVVVSLDFNFIRLIAIVYWARLLYRGELREIRWMALDYAVLAWVGLGSIVFAMREGDVSAVINRAGYAYETIGIYFALRALLKTRADILALVSGLALIAIPVSAFFLFEKMTGRNVFAVMGGVPAETLVREGRRRAQGAFSHPIMAGSFWAIALILFSSFVLAGKRRTLAVSGCIAALAIVGSTASSTPVFAVLLGGIGMAFGYARILVRPIRLATPFVLLALHMVMQKPVWHLIARISAVGGSTGWHRYHLIDAAINNFSEWALLGTSNTAHWGLGLADVTNQYIVEGVRGGFITLVAFLVVLTLSFRNVGAALKRFPRRTGDFWIVWSVGASLFAHALTFIAVAYFGQTTVMWLLSLALSATVCNIYGGRAQTKHSGNTRRGIAGVKASTLHQTTMQTPPPQQVNCSQ